MKDKVFVNISNRPFEARKYNQTAKDVYSYKPDVGYWGAIKKDSEYFSEWDRAYGLETNLGEAAALHITSFQFNPERVYELHPSQDDLILEGFNNFIEGKSLTAIQKRKLLVEYLRDKKGMPNIEHVICTLDDELDMIAMERIFGGFDRASENTSPEIFQNLAYRMRSAFVECFSGVEVTDAALDDGEFGYGINRCAQLTAKEYPGYIAQAGFWDVASVAVFDTDAIDITETKVLTDKEVAKIEGARNYDDDWEY